MAVKLRPVRMGKKKQPTYRVVAADAGRPATGASSRSWASTTRVLTVRSHRPRQGRRLAPGAAHRLGAQAARDLRGVGRPSAASRQPVRCSRRRPPRGRNPGHRAGRARRGRPTPRRSRCPRRTPCFDLVRSLVEDRRPVPASTCRRRSRCLASPSASGPPTWAVSSASGAGSHRRSAPSSGRRRPRRHRRRGRVRGLRRPWPMRR